MTPDSGALPLPLLRDRVRPGVRILFVGINPGIRSSLTGHHFAGFSPGIDTLRPQEYVEGRVRLRRKVYRYKPEIVVAVGVTVFRALFPGRRGPVALGPQPERIGGSAVFVLPNPSGRNANFSYREMLAAFRTLRDRTAR
jgi:TDG/mug DNA glycosylase family protein